MIMLCFSKNTHKIRLASEAGLILCCADIFNFMHITGSLIQPLYQYAKIPCVKLDFLHKT